MLHPDSIQITSTYKSVAGLSAAISGSKKNTFVFFRRMEFWLFLVFSLSVPCFPLLTVFTLVDDCEFARCWLFKSGRSPSPGRKCLSFLPASVLDQVFWAAIRVEPRWRQTRPKFLLSACSVSLCPHIITLLRHLVIKTLNKCLTFCLSFFLRDVKFEGC